MTPLILTTFILFSSPSAWSMSWPKAYSVSGVIGIPFAEVQEPFQAFYDGVNGKSRIDFYGGVDKTFQRQDRGQMFKVIPMTRTKASLDAEFGCVGVNDSSVKAQSVLPDLDGFKMLKIDVVRGKRCEKWQKKLRIGQKINKYTMWMEAESKAPVRYEMRGFNSLLGSHYDHYTLDYDAFDSEAPPKHVFEAYRGHGPCTEFPGPGHDVYLMNPMKEFVEDHQDHVDEAFARFAFEHNKTYRAEDDESVRKDLFRHNLRFIHSKNRQGLSYKLKTNHMADWTEAERRSLRGRLHTPGPNGGRPFHYTPEEAVDAPATLDWRLFGAVTPVKDQSMCGSCWSFGTVGTLEGANFIKTGVLTRFSQQALMDCSWAFGNNGCDGGEDFRVYDFMIAHGGIPTEDDYGPYLGNDGVCHFKDVTPAFSIKGFVNVTSGSLEALKVALAKHGPISVGIDASHRSLSFYSHGVYYEDKCDNRPEGLDHAVLAVGYGEIAGEKYWLVKNSWSTYWGNDGYVLMAQRDNNCGVATSPTFVIPA